ncbi:MAG TPA: hypothetical protein VGG74_01530 [Kofleriaceae bacterium]|jgi:hypothetical protein
MDEADIYYVDTRNAEPGVISVTRGPAPTSTMQVMTPRSVYGRPQRVLIPHAVAGNRFASSGYPSPYMAAGAGALGGIGGMFGGMTGGQLVDLVAQIFAAVMPLPSQPTPTNDAGTDIANGVTFTAALAQYAKRDEQIRTLGSLVSKLLG